MPNWLRRLTGGAARADAPERKEAVHSPTLFAMTDGGAASWSGRGYASVARNGYMRNPVVYRCVRLIAEAASRVPLLAMERGTSLADHPVIRLDGEERTLCLTLGALAELEARLGAGDLTGLAERFAGGKVSARDLMAIIGAGLRGAGHAISDAELARMRVEGGLKGAAEAAARLLKLTFGEGG